MADRVKRWFRRSRKDKQKSSQLAKDPFWGDKRSRSIPRSWEAGQADSLPRQDSRTASLERTPRPRTPNGSLEGYYLETDINPYPTMQNGGLRSRSEPRFKATNMDNRLRARDHGYYVKAAGLNEQEVNKENVRMIYDRSRMTSPNRSGYPSAYASHQSRYASKSASRNESFRDKQRMYRPNKRSAPVPPSAGHSRQNSHDGHVSNGDVAMKIQRKKRKAPPPPLQRTWSEQNAMANHTSAVQTDVYPIEPPIDYDRQEPVKENEYDTPIPVIPAPPPPPPIQSSQPQTRADSPEPPPLPPRNDEQETEQTKDRKSVTRMGSVLRKDIVKAAKARAKKGYIEPGQSQYRNAFHEFEEELSKAVDTRNKRIGFGTLRMRHISRSKMFKARPSKAEITPPLTPEVEVMLERAHEQGALLRATDDEQRKLRQSARILTKEWTPEQDLDDVFDAQNQGRVLTQRGSDYYDIDILPNGDAGKSNSLLYRKAKYAKPNRNSKKGNLEKLRRSIGKAFGSIGKSLHKKGNEVEDLYPESEGWQIQYSKRCDLPPPGPIAVKRIEKYPAYAYHPQKGQLVLLPDYDRIIITEDGQRIREADLAKMNKEMPVLSQSKQRPSLEGVFDSGGVTQTARMVPRLEVSFVEEERTEIEKMEMQFEQVRMINKQETGQVIEPAVNKPWRSTPDLSANMVANGYGHDGVISDSDLHFDDPKKSKKKKRSLKKSKSKKSSSSSDGKSPRQKVLRKGLDYYLKQVPSVSNTNPVFSSDDEDEGVVHSDPNSDSSNSKTTKADSLGDSGIGQESLNSSANSMSHSPPIPASFMQAGVDANGKPLYYAASPVNSQPVVMTPSYHPMPTGNPFMYQTMYYPTHPMQPTMAAFPQPVMSHQPINMATQPLLMQAQPVTMQQSDTTPTQTLNRSAHSSADIQNQSRISSDSVSTLVASEPNTSVLNDTKSSSSKVLNISENIALVSYNTTENKDGSVTPTNIETPTDESQSVLRKRQLLMGPVGYRPIKFDPNVKSKPVTLPERTLSFNGPQTHPVPYPFGDRRSKSSSDFALGASLPESELRVLNDPGLGNTGDDKVLLNGGSTMDTQLLGNSLPNTQVLNDKPPSALSSMHAKAASLDVSMIASSVNGDVTQPMQAATSQLNQDNNNNTTSDKPSGEELQANIPSAVMEQYGHEDLVAL